MAEPAVEIDHIERWRRIVMARREQHDAACAAQNRTTDDYWARRAEGYRKFARQATPGADSFLDCVLLQVTPEDTVLDVGAGTGRHALVLARHASQVIAVDPSKAMLGYLREDAAAEGLTNIEVVEGGWPEAATRIRPVEIVISSHVLYPIEDIQPFLHALDRHARRACFLYLMVQQPWFDRLGLWEAVHGEPRRPQPTYIDVVNVLHQLGCYASAEIRLVETPRTFDTLDDAFERFAEALAVGEEPKRQRRLRDALAERLRPLDDGRLEFPEGRYPLATVWWEAGALQTPRTPGTTG